MTVGNVKAAKVNRDLKTGYSYGFGFIEYYTHEDAKKAIEQLNGLPLQTKRIKVAFSRKNEPGQAGNCNVFFQNLPPSVSKENLEEVCRQYGSVVECRLIMNKFNGKSKGIAFVYFGSQKEADSAIGALNGYTFPGSSIAIQVKHADQKDQKVKPPHYNYNEMWNIPAPYYPGFDDFEYHNVNPMMRSARGGFPPHGHGHGGYDRGGRGTTPPRGRGAFYGGGPVKKIVSPGRGFRYNPLQQKPPDAKGCVLFVYNIGTHCSEEILHNLFVNHGTVMGVDIIRDSCKENAAKFAFVTMSNAQEAQNAILHLNGFALTKRPLQVKLHDKA